MRLITAIIFVLLPSITFAASCPTKYDGASLPYPSRQSFCPNGTFFIDYLTGKKHPCEDGDIDHIFPRNMAHRMGICGKRLEEFSKDRNNLRMTVSRYNRQKSNQNPFLYAINHGQSAEKNVDEISKIMQSRWPELRINEMKNEANLVPASIKEQIRRLYNQKEKATKRLATITSVKRRISKRLIRALARNSALTAAETSTIILAPIALGSIAWDIHDACATLKDLDKFDQSSDDTSGEVGKKQTTELCGLSKSELYEAITGKNLKFERCVEDRLLYNKIDPSSCKNFELEIPNYMGKQTDKGPVTPPTYD